MASKHFTLQYIIIIIINNIYLQLLYKVTMHLPVKRKTWCTVKNYPNQEICMSKFKEKYTVGLRIICTLIASIARADRHQWSARILLAPWSRSARILLAKWSRAFLIASIFASNHSTLSNSVGCRFQYSSFTLQFSIFLHRNHALVFFRGDLKCSKHLVELSVAKQTCMFRKSLVHNIGFILRLFHSLKSTSFVTYIVMDAFDKTATAK